MAFAEWINKESGIAKKKDFFSELIESEPSKKTVPVDAEKHPLWQSSRYDST